MSRVGKYPVEVPKGVTVEVANDHVVAKGKLGELRTPPLREVTLTQEDGKIVVKPASDTKRSRMMWGTARNLIRNVIKGVGDGYTVNLEISGVGYRAAVEGKALNLSLGYSHPVSYPIPEGITIRCERPTAISISGADKQRVGQVAAEIRAYRPPEPYKGKGIKYETETILRKEGKKK